LKEYSRDPIDLEDFFDGLNSLGARYKIEYYANGGK